MFNEAAYSILESILHQAITEESYATFTNLHGKTLYIHLSDVNQDVFFTFFNPKLSFSEKLNKIVLSTPVSKIKDNFVLFTSTGITMMLLIN